MPPHIVLRGSTWYLINGRKHRVSLKTNKKGIAEYKLKEYFQGQLGIKKSPTVKEYYETWIEKQKPPLSRKSAVRDYRQHFSSYLLPEFASTLMATLGVSRLSKFRSKLLGRGLSVKTCQNVLNGSFRALWRAAKKDNLVQHNPFAGIEAIEAIISKSVNSKETPHAIPNPRAQR